MLALVQRQLAAHVPQQAVVPGPRSQAVRPAAARGEALQKRYAEAALALSRPEAERHARRATAACALLGAASERDAQ